MSKQIEIANPRTGEPRRTSEQRANCYVTRGQAVMKEGQLLFLDRASGLRTGSDVYVDPRGTIWWNGSGTRRNAMRKPGENMFGPKGNPRARNLFEVIGHLQKAGGVRLGLQPIRSRDKKAS